LSGVSHSQVQCVLQRKISEIVKLTHYRTLKALGGSTSSASTAATVQLFKLGRRSWSDRPTKASPILVSFGAHLLSLSKSYAITG